MTRAQLKAHNAKAVMVNGVPYDTLTDAWRSGTVKSYGKLRATVANNESADSAALDKRQKKVTVNGVEYSSVTQAAEKTDISINRIYNAIRIQKSRTVEISKVKTAPGRKTLELSVNGVNYASVAEASKATGVSVNAINKRLVNNASRCFVVHQDKRYKPITVNGVSYSSLSEAVMHTGICFSTIAKYKRLQGDNLTIDTNEQMPSNMRIEFHNVGLDKQAQAITTIERKGNEKLWAKYPSIPTEIYAFDVEHTTYCTFTVKPQQKSSETSSVSLGVFEFIKIHKDIRDTDVVLETAYHENSSPLDKVYLCTCVTQETFEQSALNLIAKIMRLKI